VITCAVRHVGPGDRLSGGADQLGQLLVAADGEEDAAVEGLAFSHLFEQEGRQAL